MVAVLKAPSVTVCLTQFLTFKEYVKVSSLNKRFNSELRESIGAKSCLHYIKLQVVDKQPLYTVNFKYPGAGASIARPLDFSMQDSRLSIAGGAHLHHEDMNNSIYNSSLISASADNMNLGNVS